LNHMRHIELFDVSNTGVTLVGAGGIGALTAIVLAKMGVGYMNIFDDDVVSEENLPTQMHLMDDLGRPKVDALAYLINAFSDDTRVFASQERITLGSHISNQIIIAAVDSIQARKEIWNASFDELGQPMFNWYIDPRMAAEEAQVYCVSRDDIDWYDRMILGQDDKDIPDLPCTRKATIFTAASVAGMIGKTLRQIATDIIPPKMVAYNILLDQMVKV
jgi:molybdopterin/thiamine biosynthesis adenylyltransferase